MGHRRLFVKQLASLAGAAAVGNLLAADRALASSFDRVRTAGHRSGTTGDASLAELPDLAELPGLADEYMLDPDVVYLNHASIGTVPRAVHEAHKAYLAACESNPWLYMWGDAWDEPREAVRSRAAEAVGCHAEDLALTHNTTEGFNTLAQGLALGPGDEVLFSTLNHPGASVCWHYRAAQSGFTVRQFSFPMERVPELSVQEVLDLHEQEIGPRTRVLVLPHIDNIVGLRHPLKELSELAHGRGVEFVAVDGAQSVGMIPLDLAGSGVDFYAASPHKWWQSPKGLGILYVRPEVRQALTPLWVTWGQARWEGSVRVFEDYGTRNLPELMALGDAIEFQQAIGEAGREERLIALRSRIRQGAKASGVVRWRSPESWSLGASLCSLEIEGFESPELFRLMNREGFVFRPFFGDGINAVRISPNLITTEAQIDRFFQTVQRLRG